MQRSNTTSAGRTGGRAGCRPALGARVPPDPFYMPTPANARWIPAWSAGAVEAPHAAPDPRRCARRRRDRSPAPADVCHCIARSTVALELAQALKAGRRPAEPVVEAAARCDALDRARPTSELTHPFRALRTPATAWALPKLADRPRREAWTFERFAAALLKTEVDSRDGHGDKGRIKAARFPARKTLEEFDFAFPDIAASRHRPAPRPFRGF